ncbi:DUF1190 domain-containing protein [Escherichia coli]|nr:DUF1190 domain-containing protein [Escherichia coli]
MKRSSNVIRERFRKVKTIKYGAIALALSSTFIMTGCERSEDISVYQNADQCKKSGSNPVQCDDDYKKALTESEKVAPKYSSQSDCSSDFGNQCQQHSSGFFWIPIMSGFHSSGNGFASQPLYNSKGNFYDAGGNSYGSSTAKGTTRTVSSSALAPKPPTTTTITRNGFGSSVARSAAHTSSGG